MNIRSNAIAQHDTCLLQSIKKFQFFSLELEAIAPLRMLQIF
ncbi:hypothetical protein [Myxosarcina sp. GI1(2024)]